MRISITPTGTLNFLFFFFYILSIYFLSCRNFVQVKSERCDLCFDHSNNKVNHPPNRPTLLPLDVVPPFSKVGIITDGGHFFTFDGNHFSVPGDCTYVLAQDVQDGNFSVVANFNKGNLLSVTVTEPKESITVKNNGNVSLFPLSLNQFPITPASYAGERVT